MELLQNAEMCSGCGMCAAICGHKAICMIADEEGFFYPSINKALCVECGLCMKACPAINTAPDREQPLSEVEVWALKNDDEIRMQSSSGGAFTAFSDIILADRGVVFGVAWDRAMRACHTMASTKSQRDFMRGSKYVQSICDDVYIHVADMLNQGKHVLFTGAACQIAAVRAYLSKKSISTESLFCVDVLCHGVSSPSLFAAYIKEIEHKARKRVTDITFRDKKSGWAGYNVRVTFDDGSVWSNNALLQTYTRLFSTNCTLRQSCYSCTWSGKTSSDVTIADFWGIQDTNKDFYDDKGVSMVVVRTEKGKRLFESIRPNIMVAKESFDSAVLRNYNLVRPTDKPQQRDAFWECFRNRGYYTLMMKYSNYSSFRRMVNTLHRFVIRTRSANMGGK